jgi:hypothetical protein
MCILTEILTHKNSDTIIAPFIGSVYPCQYAVRLTFTAATALALALALALLQKRDLTTTTTASLCFASV